MDPRGAAGHQVETIYQATLVALHLGWQSGQIHETVGRGKSIQTQTFLAEPFMPLITQSRSLLTLLPSTKAVQDFNASLMGGGGPYGPPQPQGQLQPMRPSDPGPGPLAPAGPAIQYHQAPPFPGAPQAAPRGVQQSVGGSGGITVQQRNPFPDSLMGRMPPPMAVRPGKSLQLSWL